MAKNSNNPRPQFMAQLKDLCRDLEKKVTDVDMETRATLHCNRVRIYLSFQIRTRCTHLNLRPTVTWPRTSGGTRW